MNISAIRELASIGIGPGKSSSEIVIPDYPVAAFVGTNSGVSSPNGVITNDDPPYSIGCWAKFVDAGQTSLDILVSLARSDTSNNYVQIYTEYPGGIPRLRIRVRRGASNVEWEDSTDLNYDVWYRVWLVVTSTTNRKIYLNGSLLFEANDNVGNPFYSATGQFCAGKRATSSPLSAESIQIFDAQFYNAELTADDVSYDFSNLNSFAHNRLGSALTGSDLVVAWPLNDGAGLVAADISENSNTGTIGNTSGLWDQTQNFTNPVRS